MQPTTYVGLDVHAESITAAIIPNEGQDVEVIELSSDLMKVRRLFRRLSDKGPVRACYEASGAGFVLQRVLSRDGFHCEVIAPSLIPRRPGDRRKTDRLDAIMLARLYRSGHLTPVHVPTEDHETLRRLLRLRTTYHSYCTATMHRISGILRNHGFVFTQGKSTWTKKHRQWLASLRQSLDGPLQTTLASNISSILKLNNTPWMPSSKALPALISSEYRLKLSVVCAASSPSPP
jgi:transposase